MWFLSLLLFLQAMIYSPPRREGWIILQNICYRLTYCCCYYEVQNIERSGADCSHCLSTTATFQKMNLIEIIESPLHYQKWPLQHDKTLGKVFFANPLIIAPPTNPEHWKWYWNKFQQYLPWKKTKVVIPFAEKSPHLCKCAYSRKFPKPIIQFDLILPFQQHAYIGICGWSITLSPVTQSEKYFPNPSLF